MRYKGGTGYNRSCNAGYSHILRPDLLIKVFFKCWFNCSE